MYLHWPVARAAEWVGIRPDRMGRKMPHSAHHWRCTSAQQPHSYHRKCSLCPTGLAGHQRSVSGTGPAGNITTALLHSPFETNLILSCDIPRIDTGTLQFIVATHKPGISVPIVNGQWQPLVAVYDHSIFRLDDVIAERRKGVHQMIRQLPHQEVDMRFYPHYHEMAFQNMNTPEELRQAGGMKIQIRTFGR